VLSVMVAMEVPRSFDSRTNRRSEETTVLRIETTVRLRRGSRRVAFETHLDNTARDHRLRVHFPTGCAAKSYYTDTAFDVVERPIGLRADNHEYMELEVETKPQQNATIVWDGCRGMAVFGVGLMETCVRDQPGQPIALTLLRATGRTVMTNGEPGGQLQGPLTFRHALQPLCETPDFAGILRSAQEVIAGIRQEQITTGDLRNYREASPLPPQASHLKVEGPVVWSSLGCVNGGVEIRLFNPTGAEASATVHLGGMFANRQRFCEVDFESNPVTDPVSIEGKTIGITVGAKRIVTLRLE
jgi:hypothetical protein